MNERKKLVVANWKMNKVYVEGLILANTIIAGLEKNQGAAEVVICPPFIHIQTIYNMLKEHLKLHVGAQNCHYNYQGAYTGEVSAAMLKSVGAEYIILGHSERRTYNNETPEIISKKIKNVISESLTPIFCCGEDFQIREKKEHFKFVKSQIEESLFDLSAESFSKIIIAYEPVWAIGTGIVAEPEQAQEMHLSIRDFIASKYGNDLADVIPIIYGGSCNASNSKMLFNQKDIDGALVGSASLKAEEFLEIVKNRNNSPNN